MNRRFNILNNNIIDDSYTYRDQEMARASLEEGIQDFYEIGNDPELIDEIAAIPKKKVSMKKAKKTRKSSSK